MAASPQFTMDFESTKNAAFMDQVESFNYLDNGLEFMHGYPHDSPAFGVPIGLPSPAMSLNALNLTAVGEYTYSSPTRPYTPPDGASISPPALGGYTLSAGELSSDGLPPTSGRASRGSGTHSPPASLPYAATIPRSHRYNPIMAPTTRASVRGAHRRRGSLRSNDDSDEDEDFQPSSVPSGSPDARRETIRKQRIESEQRRRDELRDGYARLKETLPASNQKSSKVSLLDRATSHLRYLDSVREQLETKLRMAEAEVQRLRNVNEALMLNTARHALPSNVQSSF